MWLIFRMYSPFTVEECEHALKEQYYKNKSLECGLLKEQYYIIDFRM